jgi:uncharacterized membrane protein YgdD (TMEM256/DUF423 family)
MTRSKDVATFIDLANAKGDIYVATAARTPSVLPIGTNGQVLVADSTTATGISWKTFYNPTAVAGKNAVINGAFDIWQRGTSVGVATSTSPYTADRWQIINGVATSALTISRQATGDTTNLPNIQYCARVQRNSGQTANSISYLMQSMETSNSIPYAGKAVTLSFYARAGANYSSASSILTTNVLTGTGTDQNANSYTGTATPINTGVTLTTTWQRFTASATLATTATEIGVAFYYTPVGTAGPNDYYEITGVQLEVNSAATPFSRATSSLQAELAACQRYYYRIFPGAVSKFIGNSYSTSTTVSTAIGPFPVKMRIAPTALEQSGTAGDYSLAHANSVTVLSGVPSIGTSTTDAMWAVFFSVGAVTAAGRAGYLQTSAAAGGANAYLGFSAEL